MNRRSFFARVLGVVAGAAVVRHVPKPQGLMLRRDAFSLVSSRLPQFTQQVIDAQRQSNRELGILIRFMKQWDIVPDQNPTRIRYTL